MRTRQATEEVRKRMSAPKVKPTNETVMVRVDNECVAIFKDIRNREVESDSNKKPSYSEIATLLIKAAYELLGGDDASGAKEQERKK